MGITKKNENDGDSMKDILYVKAEQNSVVKDRQVKLQDVVTLYCIKKEVVQRLKEETLYQLDVKPGDVCAFSILKVYEVIHRVYPDITIENLGEQDFVLEYQPTKKKVLAWEYTKAAVVAITLFFGAAFTIMTFNEDVAVAKVFNHFYEFVMGSTKQGGTVLEASYAVGLPIGILLFYNHFRTKKMRNDPTPIQVEMRSYEEQVNKAMIENASREGETIDVNS